MTSVTLTKYIIFRKYNFANDNRSSYLVKTIDSLKALESVCKAAMNIFHKSKMTVNPEKFEKGKPSMNLRKPRILYIKNYKTINTLYSEFIQNLFKLIEAQS